MSIYDYQGNVVSGNIVFVSVTDYGAKGDGTTNDSTAIQSALDALKDTGGIIYFPQGTYRLNTNVLFYSNQTLWFENGAKLLQGASIDNLLMSYCGNDVGEYNGTHDCVIYGAVFDGGTYTTNNTLVGIVHCKNITFENCTFKNAYGKWHNLEINSSYNVKVINCDFEGSRKNHEDGCMIQIDAINNTNTWPWNNRGLVDNTASKYVEICNSIFHDNSYSPAIGNHSQVADYYTRIHDNVFDGLTSSRGAINFLTMSNTDIYSNTFNGCTKGIGSGGTSCYIYENRFVDVETPIVGIPVSHNNMINGTYTA